MIRLPLILALVWGPMLAGLGVVTLTQSSAPGPGVV